MVQGNRVGAKGPSGRKIGHQAGKRPIGIKKPGQDRKGGKLTSVKKGGKLTSVKNQIRAVKRLLARGGLAPKAVAEQERRLEQLTDSLEEHQKADKARKYATKYHKVRRLIWAQALQVHYSGKRLMWANGTAVPLHMLGANLACNRTCRLQVRFFERVKIERQISRLERQPAPDSSEVAVEQAARLAALRDDLTVSLVSLQTSSASACTNSVWVH